MLANFLLIGTVGLIVAHSLTLYSQKRFAIFDPLNAFWIGILICYVMQPLTYGEVFRSWHEEGIFEKTLFWIVVGLCSVVVGYESRLGQGVGLKLPSTPRSLNPRGLLMVGIIAAILGLIGYIYLIATAGNTAEWFAVGRGGTDWEVVFGYWGQLIDMLPFGFGLLLFHVELHRVTRTKRIIVWVSASLLVLWFLYLGSRSKTIAFLATMLLAYYLPKQKTPPAFVMLGGVFILLIAINFQGQYRENFRNLSFNFEEIDIQDAIKNSLPSFLVEDDYAPEIGRGTEFNAVMTVVNLVPEQVDYNYGYGHLEIFTRPIPRAIWEDKIYPSSEAALPIFLVGGLTDTWVLTSKEALLMGPALTFVGHWYAVGGPIMLLVAGFFTGSMLRMIRTIYDRSQGGEGDMILFANLLMIGFYEAAATPLVWIFNLPFVLGALIMIFYFTGISPQMPETRRIALEEAH